MKKTNINKKELFGWCESALVEYDKYRISNLNKYDFEKRLYCENPYLHAINGVNSPKIFSKLMFERWFLKVEEGKMGLVFEYIIGKIIEKRFNRLNLPKEKMGKFDIIYDHTSNGKSSIIAVQIKSSWNSMNSAETESFQNQINDFKKHNNKKYDNVVVIKGGCYGNKYSDSTNLSKIAGQEFFEFVSGDKEMYIKLINIFTEIGHSKTTESTVKKLKNKIIKDTENKLTKRFTKNNALDMILITKFISSTKT